MKKFLFLFLLIIGSFNTYPAEYKIESLYAGDCAASILRIKGEISDSEYELFKKVLQDVEEKRLSDKNCILRTLIVLNSAGGDVVEAMKMGRLIREKELATLANECLSSCVLVFSGGAQRSANSGTIGIHRPYFSKINTGLNATQIRLARQKMERQIKDYFNEMDINPTIVDAMLATEPSKISYLNQVQLNYYRLNGDDPNIDEREIARKAAMYNISSSEYRKRSAVEDTKCLNKSTGVTETECSFQVMLGVDLMEADRRIKRFKSMCTMSDKLEKERCFRMYIGIGK